MSKLKLLHMVDTFEPAFERDQVQIVNACVKRGYDTTVITSTYDSDGKHKLDLKYNTYNHVTRTPSFIPRYPLIINLPCRKHLEKYDIIHAYTMGSYNFFLANIIKNRAKALIVRAEMSPSWYRRTKNNILWRSVMTSLLKRADAVYAFTKGEKSRLQDVGVEAKIIPVGVDYNKFSKIVRLRSSLNHITIGYIGRFVEFKGAHRLINPLLKIKEEYPDVRILFTGTKTDKAYADSILKHKEFEYREMQNGDFLADVDIVIVPSIEQTNGMSETGSIVTLEAMAAGKVVIASNICPMNEYIDMPLSGFLVDNDIQIYLYCKRLIENAMLIKIMGEYAKRIAAKFDTSIMTARLFNLYDEVLLRKQH